MKIYLIQQPRSNTNPTDKYRVIESSEWGQYVAGNCVGVLPTYFESSDYRETQTECDKLNAAVQSES